MTHTHNANAVPDHTQTTFDLLVRKFPGSSNPRAQASQPRRAGLPRLLQAKPQGSWVGRGGKAQWREGPSCSRASDRLGKVGKELKELQAPSQLAAGRQRRSRIPPDFSRVARASSSQNFENKAGRFSGPSIRLACPTWAPLSTAHGIRAKPDGSIHGAWRRQQKKSGLRCRLLWANREFSVMPLTRPKQGLSPDRIRWGNSSPINMSISNFAISSRDMAKAKRNTTKPRLRPGVRISSNLMRTGP